MSRRIWIMNHYATNNFFNKGGRHYWFAKELMREGYQPVIFCANTRHNSRDVVEVERKYTIKLSEGIPFVFVKASTYSDNSLNRIKNMLSFYKNLFSVKKDYVKKFGKPDIILASSVHPLTLVAGIQIAKKLGVPCICEVRDLWPESLVAYGILKRDSLFTKLLYQGEKWIYKNANSIIMTWEGGKQYIKDQGWENQIDLKKVHHISNGVLIEEFDKNSELFKLHDPDLESKSVAKVVYTGSIRKVNNIGLLLDVARVIQDEGREDIKFFIYGSGDEMQSLIHRCENENINNVIFKGHVEKKYIPYILKSSDLNILHNSSTSLDKYGQSQNKLFEYLAAGRCIIQTYTTGYNIYQKFNCGISVRMQNKEEIARTIINLVDNEKRRVLLGNNARKISYEFDFRVLTKKLINIIENLS